MERSSVFGQRNFAGEVIHCAGLQDKMQSFCSKSSIWAWTLLQFLPHSLDRLFQPTAVPARWRPAPGHATISGSDIGRGSTSLWSKRWRPLHHNCARRVMPRWQASLIDLAWIPPITFAWKMMCFARSLSTKHHDHVVRSISLEHLRDDSIPRKLALGYRRRGKIAAWPQSIEAVARH